jgi:hypothetical protein
VVEGPAHVILVKGEEKMIGCGANLLGLAPEDLPQLEGKVVLMRADTKGGGVVGKGGKWAAHCAMVAIAPTLVRDHIKQACS